MTPKFLIRDVMESDFREWRDLYLGYLEFYKVEPKEENLRKTFDWILSDESIQQGFLVESEGQLVALAHFQIQPNPLRAEQRMYLNDLYIRPSFRGKGLVELIIEALKNRCVECGISDLRWLTSHDNYRARAAYDRHAKPIGFLTYQAAMK